MTNPITPTPTTVSTPRITSTTVSRSDTSMLSTVPHPECTARYGCGEPRLSASVSSPLARRGGEREVRQQADADGGRSGETTDRSGQPAESQERGQHARQGRHHRPPDGCGTASPQGRD